MGAQVTRDPADPFRSISGSSPWMLITAAHSQLRAAQAIRSVPLAHSVGVISTSPPKNSTARAMRSSSVSTTTRSSPWARAARR